MNTYFAFKHSPTLHAHMQGLGAAATTDPKAVELPAPDFALLEQLTADAPKARRRPPVPPAAAALASTQLAAPLRCVGHA